MFDVDKAFGSTQVLRHFTLTVDEGQTLSIIGGSGSGKSTALKHMVGLLRPDEGEVYVDDENVSRLDQESLYALRRNVGYVFQFAALFDSMTIAENVGMGLKRMPDMSDEAIDERVAECLQMVGLLGRTKGCLPSCPGDRGSEPASPGRSPRDPSTCSTTSRLPGSTPLPRR